MNEADKLLDWEKEDHCSDIETRKRYFKEERVQWDLHGPLISKKWLLNLSGNNGTDVSTEQITGLSRFIKLHCWTWQPLTPRTAARQASLSITRSRSSLRLTSIESVMPSSHLILWRLLLLLPPVPPSIRVFSNESTLCMRWPKHWSFSFSIITSKEIPGLISRMDWLDLLAVQGTLRSLLQQHSSKASILRHSVTELNWTEALKLWFVQLKNWTHLS